MPCKSVAEFDKLKEALANKRFDSARVLMQAAASILDEATTDPKQKPAEASNSPQKRAAPEPDENSNFSPSSSASLMVKAVMVKFLVTFLQHLGLTEETARNVGTLNLLELREFLLLNVGCLYELVVQYCTDEQLDYYARLLKNLPSATRQQKDHALTTVRGCKGKSGREKFAAVSYMLRFFWQDLYDGAEPRPKESIDDAFLDLCRVAPITNHYHLSPEISPEHRERAFLAVGIFFAVSENPEERLRKIWQRICPNLDPKNPKFRSCLDVYESFRSH